MLSEAGANILRQHHAVTVIPEGKSKDFPHEV
jgi:hypothetical protein